MNDDVVSEPVEDWLRQLEAVRGLSGAGHAVVQSIINDPETASYAAVADLASAAGVDGSTITRTARALGYDGWPAFKQELRSRFLGQLSLPQVASVRNSRTTGHPFDDTVHLQIENLTALRRAMDRRALSDVATAMANAPRRFVIASGSFAGLARVLAHNATIAGYRTELLEEQAMIANTLATLQRDDVVLCISFWRLFKSTVTAARQVREAGATVCVLSDQPSTLLAEMADHLLIVPADSASVFPSLVPALTLVDALLAQLASANDAHTRQALAYAEAQWKAFDIVHFPALADTPQAGVTRTAARRSPTRRPRKPPGAPS